MLLSICYFQVQARKPLSQGKYMHKALAKELRGIAASQNRCSSVLPAYCSSRSSGTYLYALLQRHALLTAAAWQYIARCARRLHTIFHAAIYPREIAFCGLRTAAIVSLTIQHAT